MESEVKAKSIVESKTFWVNVITFILAIIGLTDPSMLGIEAGTLLWISSILNIALRFITTGAVSLPGTPK